MSRHVRAMVIAGWTLLLVGCEASIGAGVGGGSAMEGSGDDPSEARGSPDGERGIAPGTLSPLSCNHGHITLAAGTYHGDLTVGGNHCDVDGAGVGQTIIEGNLSLGGNHNRVRGVTVNGAANVAGNHCLAEHVQVRGAVDLGGNHSSLVP